MKPNALLFAATAALLLAGCGSSTEDLDDWIKTVKARPAGPTDPLPEISQAPSFEYSAQDMRSPFADLEPDLEEVLTEIAEGCDSSVQPDPNRRREDLERFSIDSMEMVGAMSNAGGNWGLIQTTLGPTEGTIFKVSVGQYLGVNHGRIIDIDEFRIAIETLVPDGQGCWEKRVINLALDE
ncbi:pilus assembly protein PilP [Pleionea sp. CnH1-48]|uniref:pilus assembly protein PilP n=1 Tax=Pleionea sp. CnH1-48 TaxID=2954494 RepID=UPI00209822A9|nr:pilus assembly protein PilP [Pleionea sp. CnH1-48]MCO7224477.1 pilus assembly protein PilP [Pleionea sp. CnH1-48]